MVPSPVPGAVIAQRYRLLTRQDSAPWLTRWTADDLSTGRHAILTLAHVDSIQSRDPSPGAVRRFCESARTSSVGRVRVVDPATTAPYVAVVGDYPASPTHDAEVGREKPSAAQVLGTTALAAAFLAVLGGGGWLLMTSIAGGDYGDVRGAVTAPTLPTAQVQPVIAAPVDTPILPSGAEIWSAVRAPDNAADATRAVDADPSTSWSTDLYRAPFGDTDNGIGVVVSFADAVDLAKVWVATPQPGAVVEIRTPPEQDGTLASTQVLGAGTLGTGATDITVDAPTGLRAVLIWVAELAPSGMQYVADLAEIGFTGR
ncbi:hypothetical protein [Rhodococcoides fascians]|uniref:hypothetical protein n=1 Tax=Rhodococcoides fascians TaxID=1828 RepID=UPI0005656EBC|nr:MULTISPECIES: hypothetical protein [Rhodococcus]OZF04098.1 hypothetical protein CH301_06330 [Rhodococcus sp. 15-1189-1-1a]OZF18774.1 hypothetical protein CH299_06875 [Rhodococcus sp. 14-2686-1-2]